MIPTKWIFIRWFFKYLSPIIGIYEKYAIKKYASLGNKYSPIFIIGTPRSGSTVLFQLITYYIDMLYVNNFMNLAREVPLIGFILNNKFFGSKKHNSFQSKFGNTNDDGLLAPNEGLFWYKWLPKDKHYTLPEDISDSDKKDLKDSFNAIMNYHNKPLIIKNLSFSIRLVLIKGLFPNAKIIYLERDIIDIVQSIINAKIKVSGELNNNWWSIKPANYEMLLDLNPVEQVVKQVYYIEKQINNDLKKFSNENVLELKYEDFGSFQKVFDNICTFLNYKHVILDSGFEINVSKKRKVSDELYETILDEINKLDWQKFTD